MDWDVGSWLLIFSLRGCVCGKKETDSLAGHGAVGMVDLGCDKGWLKGSLDDCEDGYKGGWIYGYELV